MRPLRTQKTPRARGIPVAPVVHLRAIREAAGFDDLLAQAERCVGQTLAAGREPGKAAVQLLGRVMQAKLAVASRSVSTGDDRLERRLDAAAAALGVVVDLWGGRQSRWLEWIIIALIAVDILAA